MTLYFYDVASSVWGNPANWFEDAAATIPANRIPTAADDVSVVGYLVILGANRECKNFTVLNDAAYVQFTDYILTCASLYINGNYTSNALIGQFIVTGSCYLRGVFADPGQYLYIEGNNLVIDDVYFSETILVGKGEIRDCFAFNDCVLTGDFIATGIVTSLIDTTFTSLTLASGAVLSSGTGGELILKDGVVEWNTGPFTLDSVVFPTIDACKGYFNYHFGEDILSLPFADVLNTGLT